MNAFVTAEGKLAKTRLRLALLEWEAGLLNPTQRDDLIAVLSDSPAAQWIYLEYFETSAILEIEAATHAEKGQLPLLPNLDQSSQLFRRSLLAAVALILVAATVAGLIHVTRPPIRELKILASADSLWSVEGSVSDLDPRTARIRKGSTVEVRSGTLEMVMDSGAKMVMQGPALVSFPKLTTPVLQHGWLWLDSGPASETFEVRTPQFRLRNLGTRFGVRVTNDGPAEIHLIHGKVEIVSESNSQKSIELSAKGRGFGISSPGEIIPLELANDPFPKIDDLLRQAANYPTTVRSQNPVGYWRLDPEPDGRIFNEIDGATSGEMLPVSTITGPSPSSGHLGFSHHNKAGHFPSKSTKPSLSLGASPSHNGLLFRESFDRTGPLNQQKPEVAQNQIHWIAGPQFSADGTITGGKGSATLNFEPMDGVIYTLDAQLRELSNPPGSEDWVALGFASGQSSSKHPLTRFIDGTVTGRAWMIARGPEAELPNRTQLSGIADAQDWPRWSTRGGNVDLRIVLDTSKGPGKWTATWFARPLGEKDFIQIRKPNRLPNESINSFGLATTGPNTRARFASLSLHAESIKKQSSSLPRAKAPSPLSHRTGAVSFWIHWLAQDKQAQIVWSAGRNPSDDSMHLRIEPTGRVGFFIENGRYDVLLTSEETLIQNHWHHLAVSWGTHAATLYLDGRPVASQHEFLGLPQGNLPDFNIGGISQNAFSTFTGAIDEIAVWTRALTRFEIEQQVRSARPTPPQPIIINPEHPATGEPN